MAKGCPRRTTSCLQPMSAVRCSRPLRSQCRSHVSSSSSAKAAARPALIPGHVTQPRGLGRRGGCRSSRALGWDLGEGSEPPHPQCPVPGRASLQEGTVTVPDSEHPSRSALRAGLPSCAVRGAQLWQPSSQRLFALLIQLCAVVPRSCLCGITCAARAVPGLCLTSTTAKPSAQLCSQGAFHWGCCQCAPTSSTCC